jgi:hypothetical protein
VNFPIRATHLAGSGRKYKIKTANATRQWSLQVLKTGATLSIVPAVDARAGNESTPAFGNAPSLMVQTMKTTGSFIVLWVSNPAGSSANILFKEGEDVFNCEPLVRSLLDLEGKLGDGVSLEALVQPVNGLHGSYANVSKGLRKLMKVVAEYSAGQTDSAPKAPRPAARRRVVEAAPSREEEAGREEAVPLGRSQQRITENPVALPLVTTGPLPAILVGSPLPTAAPTPRSSPDGDGGAETETIKEATPLVTVELPETQPEIPEGEEVAGTPPAVARQGPVPRRLSPDFRTPVVAEMIVEEPPSAPEAPVQNEVVPADRQVGRVKATRRGRASQVEKALVPQTSVKRGGVVDLKQSAAELRQFSENASPFYPFGKIKRAFIHVDKMQAAPAEYKYRPFHSRLRDIMVGRLSTALAVPKQTFTLMPVMEEKPTDFKDMVANQNFYIIDGQHTYAAVMVILADPDVSSARKEELKKWKSEFVWTANAKDASHISARCNAHNGYRWDEPEYLLHLQFVRDIWVSLERPVKVVIGRKSQLVNSAVERWKVSSAALIFCTSIRWAVAQRIINNPYE